MTVFDTRAILYDNPKSDTRSVTETVETLDAELTRHGISHAFTLPETGDPTKNGKYPVLNLFYDGKDDLALSLIVCLHTLQERNSTPEKVATTLVKLMAKHLPCEAEQEHSENMVDRYSQ
jgi:hypothetical protein